MKAVLTPAPALTHRYHSGRLDRTAFVTAILALSSTSTSDQTLWGEQPSQTPALPDLLDQLADLRSNQLLDAITYAELCTQITALRAQRAAYSPISH